MKRLIRAADKKETKSEIQNPKLEGSNIVDCIPQTGLCPNKCGECFYNHDGFYRTKDEPLIPTLEEAVDKIVRINSGHDSNIDKDRVIAVAEWYPKKFFNTSLPYFEFPGPVVFTCNGRDTDTSAIFAIKRLDNLMMVRFRTNLWNLKLLEEVIEYYYRKNNIPVTLTFMRYTDPNNIPDNYKKFYEQKKHVLNSYYCLRPEEQKIVLERYRTIDNMVNMCGTPNSSFCRDCNRCEWCYNRFFQQIEWNDRLLSVSH